MSKKHLTLADLKKQGLKLSKSDAQELHHLVSHTAQRGVDEDIIFPGEDGHKDDKTSGQNDDEVPAITIESRIEYLGHEDFTFDDEKQAWIDEEGTIVTKEEVYAKYAADEDFYTLVGNRIIDGAPVSKLDPVASGKPVFQLPIAGEHHATKKKRQKEQGVQDYVITQEDIDLNADLATQGIKVGDTVEIPVPPAE